MFHGIIINCEWRSLKKKKKKRTMQGNTAMGCAKEKGEKKVLTVGLGVKTLESIALVA